MFIECRHILPSGKKCRAAALNDQPFCYHHTRARRKIAEAKAAGGQITFSGIEDRSDVRLALSQVLNAISSGALDSKKARLLLYGLQLISNTLPKERPAQGEESVTNVKTDADGNELAPPVFADCNEDNCDNCKHTRECPDADPLLKQNKAPYIPPPRKNGFYNPGLAWPAAHKSTPSPPPRRE